MPDFNKSNKFCLGLCWFFLVLGIFSRIFIYARGQNLWLDEASLWESVKPVIGIFDYSEFTLRFLPLLAGIATLFLSYIFAKREFGVRFACMYLFLIVSSDPLLFYSVNFSFYGIEALLMVLCLCAWSFSKKNTAVLILSISAASIFCIACNYNAGKTSTYWLNINAVTGPTHGFAVLSIWFKDFFVQMLGRHFINFHYFVFGKFVWINALIFVLPFCFGSVFLYKEKKSLLLAVFAAIFILALLYIFKIAPLGMPYNDFMRIMRNWSQMQVVGSKYLVFVLPLVFIPIAFFIHRVFLRVGNGTLITAFCVFALIAISCNLIRIHKGIGSPESIAVLQQINKNASAKSLVFVDSASRPIFEYYISKSPFKDNENLNYLFTKNNGYMYLNDSVFIGKHNGKAEELFDIMKNFNAENGFFFFTYSNYNSVKKSNELIEYVQKYYNGKSNGFQARLVGAAWVRLN